MSFIMCNRTKTFFFYFHRKVVINTRIKIFRISIAKQYSTFAKRFYKNVNIVCNDDGNYEITLDHRKLKTTAGNPLKIDNQALTLAVAAEWDAQKEKIQKGTMYLTSLCSSVIDNPGKVTKSELIHNILNSLDTDTTLFFSAEDNDLFEMQLKEWKPVIEWFNNEFSTDVKPTTEIIISTINADLKGKLKCYLESYEFPAVYGFSCIVDSLKSFIITAACVKRFVTVEKAVALSRLEEEFQSKKWGKVEWSHTMNEADALARVSSAVLFIHFNSSTENSIHKQNQWLSQNVM